MTRVHWEGVPPYDDWFAWYPVRDEDGTWCWLKYVRRELDGTIKRYPGDVAA